MTIIIETESGKIKGYSKDNLQIFKGIPYAEPPIGPLRFSPPVPREPWSDVLDATNFGPYTVQGFNPLEMVFGKLPIKQDEAECLSLNIWTPAIDGKRPVMVWIHGGGFLFGSGADPIYNGLKLASYGDVIVATLNYRLGAFGFLHIPGVTANVGLLDQIAALKWIKSNVESFGGDPNNITIFGESAGGMSVTTLLAMPAAEGLFQHAIAQSGSTLPYKTAIESSDKLMSKLGIEAGDIDALREVPVEKIIKVQNKMGSWTNLAKFLPFFPRIDGDTLPKHPLEMLRDGSAKNVDLMIGTNQEEWKLFSAMAPDMIKDDDKLYNMINAMMNFLGQDENMALDLVNIYKARKDLQSKPPSEVMDAIGTDFLFRIPATRVAEAHHTHQPNTYNYLFTWKSPLLNGRLGSCHAIELPFVFGTYDLPKIDMFVGKGTGVETLSQKMMDTWIAFARTGNPYHEGIPEWPPYDAEKRSTMLLGSECKVVTKFLEKERKAWDGII